MSALFRELVINHGLVIGICFSIVFAALLLVETPRPRRATSLRAKLDTNESARYSCKLLV